MPMTPFEAAAAEPLKEFSHTRQILRAAYAAGYSVEVTGLAGGRSSFPRSADDAFAELRKSWSGVRRIWIRALDEGWIDYMDVLMEPNGSDDVIGHEPIEDCGWVPSVWCAADDDLNYLCSDEYERECARVKV